MNGRGERSSIEGSRPTLAERILLVDRALSRVPHAFGGAIALAYYAEPRATVDVDLNVFVPPERFDSVAARLRPLGVAVDDEDVRQRVAQEGQVRVFWDHVPLDLFFAYDRFHRAAAREVRRVPFADRTIPILAASHLVVCKVVFDRPKDWVDIEAMATSGADIDVAEVLRWLGRILGDEDRRYDRVAALLARR
ncbi:MAG: hypothetical protein KatS3mg008_1690 [Acidimicrobiales bacterium]|nr:MAG: hypothetical protein KatS3mg008_1690 [Acidimicrobiales bacterium]